MDRQITVRFFKIRKYNQNTPNFEDACNYAMQLSASPNGREKILHNDFHARMERFSKGNQFCNGEIVRVQRDNIPPEAKDFGLTPLNVDGLGHAIAFCYSPILQIIAIQYDNRAVSIKRLCSYLKEVNNIYNYLCEPIVTNDAWARYNNGQVRKFEISIASPSNLHAAEGSVGAITTAGRNLADMSNAPIINIEVSMGRKKGGLNRETIKKIIRHFTGGRGMNDDVRKLRVSVKNEEAGSTDPIDFFDDKLVCKEQISFNGLNADDHYKRRENFLLHCYRENWEYLTSVYGT